VKRYKITNHSQRHVRNFNNMTKRLLYFFAVFLAAVIIGALCRMPFLLNIFLSFLMAVGVTLYEVYEYRKQYKKVSKADIAWMQKIAEQWGDTLACDDIHDYTLSFSDDKLDAYFTYRVRSSDLSISFFTYANPYTQAVKDVIDNRLNDILQIDGITEEWPTERSLFGALFHLHVSRDNVNDQLLERMKELFERIKEDELSHQTGIYFKVVGIEYDNDVCYFECSFQSEIKRAMIVYPDKILRYDVSKGDSLPDLMNDLQYYNNYCIEDDETLELLPPQEFQRLWESDK